jgi:hypothetical protein
MRLYKDKKKSLKKKEVGSELKLGVLKVEN